MKVSFWSFCCLIVQLYLRRAKSSTVRSRKTNARKTLPSSEHAASQTLAESKAHRRKSRRGELTPPQHKRESNPDGSGCLQVRKEVRPEHDFQLLVVAGAEGRACNEAIRHKRELSRKADRFARCTAQPMRMERKTTVRGKGPWQARTRR
jgi:hypothetical protein